MRQVRSDCIRSHQVRLRDGRFLVELRALPFFIFQHLFQMLNRVPNILKTNIQRREPKAQDVGLAGAEIANHAARNQGLHDGERG